MSTITSKSFHKFWLKVTAGAICGYALLFFLGTIKATSKPIQVVLDYSSWPVDGLQDYDAQTTVFLSALLGGILLGWGVMIWLISLWFYDRVPEQSRRIVLVSVLTWFFVDSLGCVFAGNLSNAVTNVALLLVLVGPLWKSAKATEHIETTANMSLSQTGLTNKS